MNIDLQAREITPVRQNFDRVTPYVGDKPASRYLEVTLSTQSTEHFHYRPTWEPEYELLDARRTAVRMSDWNALRDPRQLYYATWTMGRARQQEAIEASYQFVESRGLVDAMPEGLAAQVAAILMPLRHVAWAGNMNNCTVCSRGYGSALTAPALMHALDHLGAAQYLTRLGLLLGDGTSLLDAGKEAWLEHPDWQPLRRLIENSLVLKDPIELFLRQNLVLDGLLYPLIYTQYLDGHVALQGGSAIAMLTTFMPEWHKESVRWVDAVLKTIGAESAENQRHLQDWLDASLTPTLDALEPIARLAMPSISAAVLQTVRDEFATRVSRIGLKAA